MKRAFLLCVMLAAAPLADKLLITGSALFAIPIARDGAVFVVHKDNPVGGLTWTQALAVFAGNTADWKALGGPDAGIEVVSRTSRHSPLEIVSAYFDIAPEVITIALLGMLAIGYAYILSGCCGRSARFGCRRGAWCASISARLLPSLPAMKLQRWWKSSSFEFRSAALRGLMR